ncbi:hypothetical protein NQ176_g8513 [Zarea fungicola]|uniref:Uncharacterized protein n=1 Tax=Zarea fungicola TaxID=93591 RepID=A0ACC1MSS9_9HYPO|nr:hypothetical protein NQ176_g8513 [Lecanicillium fungicola]
MQPFQSRLEELSRHVEQLKIATGELAEVMNAARSNEQNTVSTLQPTAIGEDNVVRFRISSSHLRLASAQFRRLLSSTYPNTLEGQLSLEDGTKCNVLGTEQWDSKVFLMLLQIVHGYNRQVPDSIDLDTLGKLAILVDYYECHERVELFARRWIEALRGQVPKAYGDAAILWLAISWVFIDKPIFKQMTQIILRHSTCPFQADTLPLPPILIENLESKKQEATRELFASVQRLEMELGDGKRGCSDACCTMLLGSVVKERRKHDVDCWWFAPPLARSLEASKNAILAFKSPIWYAGYGSSSHGCTPVKLLRPEIDEIWASIEGFDIEDYVPIYERTTSVAT